MDMLNSFSKFSDRFKKLYHNTNPKMLEIEGIAPQHLDISLMASRYLSEDVVDV